MILLNGKGLGRLINYRGAAPGEHLEQAGRLTPVSLLMLFFLGGRL